MILKDQEILKFDVVDSNNYLIPNNVEIKNIDNELDLTLDFTSNIIGKASNIRKTERNMISDIQLFSDKDVLKNKIFRPNFKSEDKIKKDTNGFNTIISIEFLSMALIPSKDDVYGD